MVLWAYSSANGAKGREIESPWGKKKEQFFGLLIIIVQFTELATWSLDLMPNEYLIFLLSKIHYGLIYVTSFSNIFIW